MNERSQAGSAGLRKGNIELCHNRRSIYDDDHGREEAMVEYDKDGYGIKVNDRYHLQIFRFKEDRSLQRTHQHDID